MGKGKVFKVEEALVAATHRKPNPNEDWAFTVVNLAAMGRVVEWCRKRRIKVVHRRLSGNGGVWTEATRTITIDPRLKVERQLHVLLHECGHALIDAGHAASDGVRYGRGYLAPGQRCKPVDRINMVTIEIDAWNRGALLAKRLQLPVRQHAFDAAKAAGIRSYMAWALEKGRKA